MNARPKILSVDDEMQIRLFLRIRRDAGVGTAVGTQLHDWRHRHAPQATLPVGVYFFSVDHSSLAIMTALMAVGQPE